MVLILRNIQAININRQNKSNKNSILKIKNNKITPEKLMLLPIEIDEKLNLEKHVSIISKIANNQLNPVCRIANLLGQKEN